MDPVVAASSFRWLILGGVSPSNFRAAPFATVTGQRSYWTASGAVFFSIHPPVCLAPPRSPPSVNSLFAASHW